MGESNLKVFGALRRVSVHQGLATVEYIWGNKSKKQER